MRLLGLVAAAGLVVAFGAAGCSEWTDAVDSRSATAGLPSTLQDLEAHRWVLDPDRSSIDVVASALPTLAFDAESVQGSASCNLFRGGFSLDGETGIEIEGLSSTRRACAAPVMAAEHDYLAALAAIDTVDSDDHDRLVLKNHDGLRLTFTPFDD
jgi:heat shock protein HslJ